MNGNKRDESRLTIRLPGELKRWLHHAAVDKGRSLNEEIVTRLEESRKREQTTEKKKP
jgi:predicted HicB family RNase H-like nuclease